MDSQIPPDARHSVEESRTILEHFKDASQRRIEFLTLMAQHLQDVVIPAVEELAAEFSDTLLEVEIDGPTSPLTPQLNVTATLRLLPTEQPQSIGFRYEPSAQSNQVEFSTQEANGKWVSLNERSINDVTREKVITEVANLINYRLKRWSAPLD